MKLNKHTKKAQTFITYYLSSEYYINTAGDIYQVYDRPSANKYYSLIGHLDDIRKKGGYDIRIISFSSQFYTLGYLTEKDNIRYLNIITCKNHYEIQLNF